MKNLLDTIKENNQDFEFYPTTQKMVNIIANNIGERLLTKGRFLDIGAGNGNFFNKLANCIDTSYLDKFAIEKSQILINQMPSDIAIIGADFHQQTLIDKNFDCIFCNPPYSEFKTWMQKIITETNCNNVIMIVPDRWQKDDDLLKLIKKRDFDFQIIGNESFLDAERSARANVDIVYFSRCKIEKEKYYRDNGRGRVIERSFVDFFNENFADLSQPAKEPEELKDQVKNELVAGNNLIEKMVTLYNIEFNNLLDSFKSLSKIDDASLKNIGINKTQLMISLHEQIDKLKNKYWLHLIHNLKELETRLIFSFKEKLLKSITHTIGNIDFNENNCYAVLIWIIKNANQSFNEQLLFMFDLCIEPHNVKKYKSNKMVFDTEERNWGSKDTKFKNKQDVNKIILDYRIITEEGSYDVGSRYYSYNNVTNDVIACWEVICYNLLGHKNFGDIKFFKNRNVHLKFNVEFSKAFNIQASLLKGWIKDKKEAMQEFDDVKESDLNFNYFHFSNNKQILLD